jgi:hypothetical protein
MIIRRLAVLSGFSTVVAERMGRSLASRQFSVAYCKLKMNDAREYMDKLLSAFDKQVNELSQEANNKIVAILVSCLSEDELINIENRTFFPLLRRFRLSPDYRADINNLKMQQARLYDYLKMKHLRNYLTSSRSRSTINYFFQS